MISFLSEFSISAVAISPEFNQDGCLFAATDQGLWVSKDRGSTWANALVSLGNLGHLAVTSVIAKRGEPGQLVIIAGVTGGFLRSEDGGITWSFIMLPQPQPLVSALAVSEDNAIYAGTSQDGVFHSKDDGKNWTRWNFGLIDRHVFAIATGCWSDGSQSVFAGTETGIFYSSNHGRTWRETSFPIDAGAVLTLGLSSGPGEELVLAATETNHIYRSLDRGTSWEHCDDVIFDGEINPLLMLGMHGLAVCRGNLFHALDGGLHWVEWDSPQGMPAAVLMLAPIRGDGIEIKACAWLADGSTLIVNK